MKIEPVACIWMFLCAMNFWAARNGKKLSFWLFMPNPRELVLFRPYFVSKCSFREILNIIFSFRIKISRLANFEKQKNKNSKIKKFDFFITTK